MNTLVSLQESGALPTSLKVVGSDDTIPFSKKEEDMTSHGAVVVDNSVWVATVNGKSVKNADRVYSSDGEIVYMWDRRKDTLHKMTLQDTETGTVLVTTKIFKFHKEEQKMADFEELEKELGDLNLDGVGEEIAKVADESEKGTEVAKATGFDVGEDEGAKEKSSKEIDREQKIAFYNNIREKIDKSMEGSVNAPAEVTRNNFINGRFLAFITPSDDSIKLSIVSSNKIDPQTKKPMLDPTVTEANIIADFNNDKRVPSSKLVKEATFKFQNAKPGKAKGVIFTIPAGTDLPLTTIGRASSEKYNLDDKTLVTHVLDYNAALLYLAYNFADRIQESSELLGGRASTLYVTHTFSTGKDGATVHRDVIKANDRKSLIIPGNYFPLKTFETVSTQDLTDENKKILNLNVEKAYVAYLNRTPDKKAQMSDAEKAKFKLEDDKVVSSVWFNEGAAINVTKYDDPSESVTNVRIPVVEQVPNKKTGGFTYRYKYNKLEDGPMNDPRYADIIKATGFSEDVFAKLVSTVAGSRKSGKSSGVNKTMSPEIYLKAYAARELDFEEGRSIADVQTMVDTLSAEIA